MNDTQDAGRGPPDDKGVGSRRLKVTARRITALLEDAPDANVVNDLASAQSRPIASQFDSIGFPSRADDARTIEAKAKIFPYAARLRVSAGLPAPREGSRRFL